ncbi:MAG: hypothetical protein LBG62_04575 [Candidatus Methanoplasma sp.]|jgi:DNA repair photolyase|nr:hypothetical protein [Candidatus Methanoplasma sp.]
MHYADYKTMLSPGNGMNVYRGCTHGRICCDSRSSRYRTGRGFEDVEVKRGAAPIPDGQLRRKRRPCMIGTGSMCDPHIPLEEGLMATRGCLEAIERRGFGLSILTKSDLVLRDPDLLKSINAKAKCVAQTTLTTFDDGLCRKLEPNAPATSDRVRALEALRDAGVPTVAWLCPILPFINDTEENLRGLLGYCARRGSGGRCGSGRARRCATAAGNASTRARTASSRG